MGRQVRLNVQRGMENGTSQMFILTEPAEKGHISLTRLKWDMQTAMVRERVSKLKWRKAPG